jgi:hypothetical protein
MKHHASQMLTALGADALLAACGEGGCIDLNPNPTIN